MLDIYLLNDQPTTCGICGARTEFIDFVKAYTPMQIQWCLNPSCGDVFLATEE